MVRFRNRGAERLAQVLADSKNDLTDVLANHRIIRTDVTAAALTFEPGFILDDFPNYRQLPEENRIGRIHGAGASGCTVSRDYMFF